MKLTAYERGDKSPADFIPAKPKPARPSAPMKVSHISDEERARRQELVNAALIKANQNKRGLGRYIYCQGVTVGRYALGHRIVPDDVARRLEAFMQDESIVIRGTSSDETGNRLRHIVVGCIEDLRMTREETARYLIQRGEEVTARWVRRQYDKALRLRGDA